MWSELLYSHESSKQPMSIRRCMRMRPWSCSGLVQSPPSWGWPRRTGQRRCWASSMQPIKRARWRGRARRPPTQRARTRAAWLAWRPTAA